MMISEKVVQNLDNIYKTFMQRLPQEVKDSFGLKYKKYKEVCQGILNRLELGFDTISVTNVSAFFEGGDLTGKRTEDAYTGAEYCLVMKYDINFDNYLHTTSNCVSEMVSHEELTGNEKPAEYYEDNVTAMQSIITKTFKKIFNFSHKTKAGNNNVCGENKVLVKLIERSLYDNYKKIINDFVVALIDFDKSITYEVVDAYKQNKIVILCKLNLGKELRKCMNYVDHGIYDHFQKVKN